MGKRGNEAFLALVADRVAAARLAAGLSVRAAAAAAGLSPTTIQRAESGANDTGVGVLYVLAVAYGTTLAELVAEKPAGPKPPRSRK